VKLFHPGELTPSSGIYIAIHPEHRRVHEVTIKNGDFFPQCRICGGRVYFQLWRQGKAKTATDAQKMMVPFTFEVHASEGLAV